MPDPERPILTPEEVIQFLRLDDGAGKPKERLRNLIRRQGLPVVRVGRLVRFRRTDVENWLDTKTRGVRRGGSLPIIIVRGRRSLRVAAPAESRTSMPDRGKRPTPGRASLIFRAENGNSNDDPCLSSKATP